LPFGIWADFDSCVADMIKNQGHDEEMAKKVCGALQARLGAESFSWTGGIKHDLKNLIRGTALHPVKTVHPEEWPSVRVYLEDELEKATASLIGAPLFLDHMTPLDGKVIAAAYEDGAIEYIAELNDADIVGRVFDGKIQHCSVEYDWSSLDKVDGVAPRGIVFQGLSLLEKFLPGDPASSVKVWESIIQRLKEAKGLAPPNPKGSETVKGMVLFERVWDRAYINDLPDSAFALVQSGGEKDEQGKTVPRSLSRLPHHRADGSIDLPHLRNAMARAPQMKDISEADRNEAVAQLEKHTKALKIGQYAEGVPHVPLGEQDEPIEFQVAPEPTLDELIESIEDIVEQINLRLDALEKPTLEEAKKIESLEGQLTVVTDQKKALEEQIKILQNEKSDLVKKLGEAVIEPQRQQEDLRQTVLNDLKAAVFERVPHSWGYGPFEQNRRIKELIKKIEGSQ